MDIGIDLSIIVGVIICAALGVAMLYVLHAELKPAPKASLLTADDNVESALVTADSV